MSAEAEAPACPSCGTAFRGAYCHDCGEKKLDEGDRTFRHFLGDAFGTLTNIDGTLWRSFRLLLVKPGALTLAYIQGERKPHLTPFRVFLLCNLVYFFAQPFTGYSGFNTTLESQRTRQFYSQFAHIDARVRHRIGAEKLGEAAYAARYESYKERFDARSSAYARTLIFLLIPLYALALKAVLPRRLYADHVVLAAHFLAWQLLVVMSAFLFFYQFALYDVVERLPPFVAHHIHEHIASLLLAVYLYLMLRRAFGLPSKAALWRTVVLQGMSLLLLPALFVLATLAYRFLLFWVAFATTPVPGG